MDIVKAFSLNENTATINIQGTHEEPLFQANQIGQILGLTNIRATISKFDDDEVHVNTIDTNAGKRECTFLTELGLYRLIMLSRKPIAKTFQKWVASVIKEIRINGKYELENELKKSIEENKNIEHMTRHRTLIDANRKKNGVYIGKIKTMDDDRIIIKIGSTTEINTRATALKHTFGEFILLDFFPSNRHTSLESAILKHPSVATYKYMEPVNEQTSTEMFCIEKHYYKEIITVIQSKIKEVYDIAELEYKYTQNKIEAIEKETQLVNAKIELANRNLEMIEKNPTQVFIENVVETKEVFKPLPFIINDKRNFTRGNKVQKYSLAGSLVATYKGTRDATRKEEGTSDTGIKQAIKNKSIYKEHRWLFLSRDLPDDTVQDIGDSVAVRKQKDGFVAMLNITKDIIVQVFPDQKSAAKERQFTSSASISQAIAQNRLSSGHYFCYFDDCSEEMKTAYLQHGRLPEKPSKINSIPVHQINPVNNEIIKIYNSILDVQKEFQASRMTLKKAIAEGTPFKNYIWRIGS